MPDLNNNAEALIASVMREHALTRDEAVTALVMQDARAIHFGSPRLVEGKPLSILYQTEMEQGHLTTEQSAKVVSYVFDIPYDAALRDVIQRIADGSVPIETKH